LGLSRLTLTYSGLPILEAGVCDKTHHANEASGDTFNAVGGF